jgi:hypothetical protein
MSMCSSVQRHQLPMVVVVSRLKAASPATRRRVSRYARAWLWVTWSTAWLPALLPLGQLLLTLQDAPNSILDSFNELNSPCKRGYGSVQRYRYYIGLVVSRLKAASPAIRSRVSVYPSSSLCVTWQGHVTMGSTVLRDYRLIVLVLRDIQPIAFITLTRNIVWRFAPYGPHKRAPPKPRGTWW